MRGLLQSSTGCRMPLARYGRAAGVKGRNPVKIGLEGPQAIWTSRSLKAGLSMPRLFLVALVQLVPLEMWGQEFLGQLLLCTCILTGTWLFLQYPACLPCCNTFNFLSWMCVRMSYFFSADLSILWGVLSSKPSRGSSFFVTALPWAHICCLAPVPLLRGSLGGQWHRGTLSLRCVSTQCSPSHALYMLS